VQDEKQQRMKLQLIIYYFSGKNHTRGLKVVASCVTLHGLVSSLIVKNIYTQSGIKENLIYFCALLSFRLCNTVNFPVETGKEAHHLYHL